MIFDREIFPSLSTTIFSLGSGSNLMYLRTINGACPEDAKKFKDIVEKKRIFKFLMGVNKNLDKYEEEFLE